MRMFFRIIFFVAVFNIRYVISMEKEDTEQTISQQKSSEQQQITNCLMKKFNIIDEAIHPFVEKNVCKVYETNSENYEKLKVFLTLKEIKAHQ